FRMSNVAPRGVMTLPWISAFPELNVRTYVRVKDKPGVYFFSLDAANPIAVGVARLLAHLPYHLASMHVEERDAHISYSSRRRDAAFAGRYRPIGASRAPLPGTLEHFLTERYCLYTKTPSHAYKLEIHHPPWPLQPAEAVITENTMTLAEGLDLPSTPPLLHF